ncbi:MAG: aminoglycoside phosphotransferase family protein [Chlamydiales bacterium]|nr:aminoglycoside phosphotransferase family protein [Chlamydiales bacterium]
MMTKQAFSKPRIIECLQSYYGIEVTSLTPLLLGADMNASVYKAQTYEKSYFVKVKSGRNHDLGVAILDVLQSVGIEQIIAPTKTSLGLSMQPVDGYTLIVYPYIEHQNGFSQRLLDDQWITFGQVLRKVHEVKLPKAIQDQIKREDYSPKWRHVVRSLYDLIETKATWDQWAKKLIGCMKEHKKEIFCLLDGAEKLAQKVRQESAEFVLCHADIHGGNVLISEDGCIYIVDWDQPIMAPKERDLMFIGAGVANVWNNPQEEEYFYKGYGKTTIHMPLLAYYRQERIVEDIAEYGQAFLESAAEEDKSEMYQQFIDMFEPNGVVDIALRTAEKIR